MTDEIWEEFQEGVLPILRRECKRKWMKHVEFKQDKDGVYIVSKDLGEGASIKTIVQEKEDAWGTFSFFENEKKGMKNHFLFSAKGKNGELSNLRVKRLIHGNDVVQTYPEEGLVEDLKSYGLEELAAATLEQASILIDDIYNLGGDEIIRDHVEDLNYIDEYLVEERENEFNYIDVISYSMANIERRYDLKALKN